MAVLGPESGFNKVLSLRRPKTASYVVPISTSEAVNPFDARGYREYGLVVPAALTSTTMTFKVSADGTNFQPLYDTANALVTVTIAAGRSYILPASLAPWPFFKVVTGSTEAAQRTFTVVAIS